MEKREGETKGQSSKSVVEEFTGAEGWDRNKKRRWEIMRQR